MTLYRLLRLLFKYGPTVYRIVRAIVDLIEALKVEQVAGTARCLGHRRTLDVLVAHYEAQPKGPERDAALRDLRAFHARLSHERGRA